MFREIVGAVMCANLIDALHNESHPDHAHARKIAAAVRDNTFERDRHNPRAYAWKGTGTYLNAREAYLAAYLGLPWCDAGACEVALGAQAAVRALATAPVEPAPLPQADMHLLHDGLPVTIAADGWWRDGRRNGVDYTIDATGAGARHWSYWPSPRFADLPKVTAHAA